MFIPLSFPPLLSCLITSNFCVAFFARACGSKPNICQVLSLFLSWASCTALKLMSIHPYWVIAFDVTGNLFSLGSALSLLPLHPCLPSCYLAFYKFATLCSKLTPTRSDPSLTFFRNTYTRDFHLISLPIKLLNLLN